MRRRTEHGQALLAVVLLLDLVLLLALVLVLDALSSQSDAVTVNASGAAVAGANAGVSTALYDVTQSTYRCSVSGSLMTASYGTVTYSVTVTYYRTFADPEPAATAQNSVSCSGTTLPIGAQFSAAVLTASSTVTDASTTNTAVVRELVKTLPLDEGFAVYSNGATLDASKLAVKASTVTADIYSAGGITATVKPTGGPVPNPTGAACIHASLVAQGAVTLTNTACVTGSVSSVGDVTLSGAAVSGSVDAWSGSVTLSDAKVLGTVFAHGSSPAGNVVLCPKTQAQANACTGLGLTSGNATVGQSTEASNADASGTITLGDTVEGAVCPGPVTTALQHDEVFGCTDPQSTLSGSSPRTVAFPEVAEPVAGSSTAAEADAAAAWVAAGYTVEPPTSTCDANSTSAGSAVKEIERATTASTVVVLDCALTLTPSAGVNLTLKHDLAIVAMDGITFGRNFKFTAAAPPPGTTKKAQLSVLVPTAATPLACDISFPTNATKIINGGANLDTLLFTPCTLSLAAAKATQVMFGQVVAGTLSIGSKLTITYVSFTVPSFSYGYQETVIERYVSQS